MHVDSEAEALQRGKMLSLKPIILDIQILEFVGIFKEFATERAQAIIDSYHVNGQFECKSSKATRFPFGENNIPIIRQDGIVYRFACNYNGGT